MTKQELESIIKEALKELKPSIQQAKDQAIAYGQGEENFPFEVGFLNSRIKNVISILEQAGES